jgi:hypothetical protein
VNFSVRPSILLNNRECAPLGVNEGVKIHPRGQISPLGTRGEVKNDPLFLNLLRANSYWASPWRRDQVLSSPPTAEETGTMGRDIEFRQCVYRVVVFKKIGRKKTREKNVIALNIPELFGRIIPLCVLCQFFSCLAKKR